MFPRKLFPLFVLFISIVAGVVIFHWGTASGASTRDICDVPTGPYPTVQSAVDDPDCTAINLTASLYIENVVISSGRMVTIQGQGPENTKIDGDNSGSVFSIQSGAQVTLTAVTVANGVAQSGGGIFNEGDLVLVNSTIRDNWTAGPIDAGVAVLNWPGESGSPGEVNIANLSGNASGAGIWNSGTTQAIDSLFSNNSAAMVGGGIYSRGVMTVTNSNIVGNAAPAGGGIVIEPGGSMHLEDSTVRENLAKSEFGAGIVSGGMLRLFRSTVSGNRSYGRLGAAGLMSGGTAILANSTVSGNWTQGVGGAIYNYAGTVVITNTTVSGNYGSSGLYNRKLGAIQLNNSIIDNAPGTNCLNVGGSSISSMGHNISSDGSCSLDAPGDQPNTDPLLEPLGDNGGPTQTHSLQPGSPAIDTGDDNTCSLTDQRGVIRPQDGDGDGIAICDIGSFELSVQTSVMDTNQLYKAYSLVWDSALDHSPNEVDILTNSDQQSLIDVDFVKMPPVDTEALLEGDQLRLSEGLPFRFAFPIPVTITPEQYGSWKSLGDGYLVWRVGIQSPGAVSLNLGFGRFLMPDGGRLSVYATGYDYVVGPFTAADNEAHGELWTPILPGDRVVIEVTIPERSLTFLDLSLTSVNHGYRELGQAPLSGSCELDVICSADDGFPQVDAWRDQIRSVAVISLGGSTFCSGFMVNNTAHDLKPYFITALHCGVDESNAASLVAYWNYQNSWCRPPGSPASGSPGDGSLTQFNTGSYFRASFVDSDFTLVELDDPPDPDFNLFWAGWDATPADAVSAVGIHHPGTDEKRISFEDDPTATTSWMGYVVPGDGTHILVEDWDIGSVEPGSSGSPIFNQDGKVVGQCHGGFTACGNDNAVWYGRFSTSWEGGGTPNSRLKDWLDPADTGILSIDGRDEDAFSLTADPLWQEVCTPDDAVYSIDVIPYVGFTSPITLTAAGHPSGTSASFSVNPVLPPGSSDLTISDTDAADHGNYTLVFTGTAGTSTSGTTARLDLNTAVPGVPSLSSPANGANNMDVIPNFTWIDTAQAASYSLEVDDDPAFGSPEYEMTGIRSNSHLATSALKPRTTYYWRITAENACGNGPESAVFSFTTADLNCSAPNLLVVDNHPLGSADSILVDTDETISDLDVQIIASHTYVGDLVFTLQHQDTGTVVTLIDRPRAPVLPFGCMYDDIEVILDDEGSSGPVNNMCLGTVALQGSPIPEEPLSAFDGEDLTGSWNLSVSDRAGFDSGILVSWCLIPTYETLPLFLPLLMNETNDSTHEAITPETAGSVPGFSLVVLSSLTVLGIIPNWILRKLLVSSRL